MGKPLRESMPHIAAWVDQLRGAFGDETIDQAIREGMAGQPTFFAAEAGLQIGTRPPENSNTWRLEGLDDRHFCDTWSGDCVGTGRRCKRLVRGL